METGKLFEQPKVYLLFFMLILFIYLMNLGFFKDETLANSVQVLFYLTTFSAVFYVTIRGKLKINSVHRNTPFALVMGLVMVAAIFISSAFLGAIFGYASSIDAFMTSNSIAMMGSISQILFITQPFLLGFITIFLIAYIETVTAINIYDLLLLSFKANYSLRDPKAWVCAVLVGFGAIAYHLYAKFIPVTNTLNIHALTIVGIMFALMCLFALKTKEMESSIYGHIINNGIAFMARYGVI